MSSETKANNPCGPGACQVTRQSVHACINCSPWIGHRLAQGIGDLYRIYPFSQRNNIDYNVACIPSDFRAVAKTMFDTDYMRSLFDLAYAQSSRGCRWHKRPSGLDTHPE